MPCDNTYRLFVFVFLFSLLLCSPLLQLLLFVFFFLGGDNIYRDTYVNDICVAGGRAGGACGRPQRFGNMFIVYRIEQLKGEGEERHGGVT